MKIHLTPNSKRDLKQCLEDSFKKIGRGSTVPSPRDLKLDFIEKDAESIKIPQGTEIFFPPIGDSAYNSSSKVRSSEKAIIIFDDYSGASIRVAPMTDSVQYNPGSGGITSSRQRSRGMAH